MLVPVKWLKNYVAIDMETKELCDKMTMSGSKVETVEKTGLDIEGVVIGKIEEIKCHPNADKLVIVTVNIGEERLQIVTGATNIAVGDYIPVAVDGAKLPGGVKIKKGKLRGEVSQGMLCSQEELAIPKSVIPEDQKDGIWILKEAYPLGKNLLEAIDLQDEVIEFEITSNRPDCLSMIGIAREVAATIGSTLKYPDIKVKEAEKNSCDKARVVIEDTEGCKRYVARVIEDVTIQPSPQWMQQRLAKAGVRPINNIVDITNYVMLEYGQPLHAFDLGHVEGRTIIVKKGERGQVFKTLDGVERKIKDYMTMIYDINKPLAIAGVMGGEESEVTSKTKNILLESAYFHPEGVRLTSKQLGLRTEASSRFEKGLDPNIARIAADRACQLIEELGAGKVLKGAVDVYPQKREAQPQNIRPHRINSLLGTALTNEEMIEILKKLEIEVKDQGDVLEVTVPTYRIDLGQEADFVEEIGRIYGYDRITATMARGNIVVGGKNQGQIIEDITKEALNAMGLHEILTYSFVSPKGVDKIRVGEGSIKRNFIKLLNPLGDETSVMRTTQLPNLLEVMARNFNRKVENFRAFELGRIFLPKVDKSDPLPYEVMNLVLGVYGEEDFFTLKGVLDSLLERLGIKDYEYVVEKHHPTFHPGRCGNIIYGHHTIGTLGEIHPEVMENYGIHKKCYCAELDFDLLLKLTSLDAVYQPLPKYPSISRDFAVVVKETTLVKEIENIIVAEGGEMLESYSLFDVYRGNQINEGYKSVAYTLTYRHKDRTLKEEEVNKVQEKILQRIKEVLGGLLRE
ncbi:phenylalanine--tRNA ligase subunit beta [Clostridium formicaceticum]|uniref:Phenylalanine--tRNA ligase beta subunit n=1 Tax=Clostridium formicaceticum TaxID=1497 RepID=A0AAC9RJC1_9CLOT|nr:phenylalanine--tRNA ligase subunit beta [Clostridium formicaceticum]AOY76389.1 phenylalanine--tRNA ligase subunit beta [Clostridium formicaceticum]ARE86782.1 Phenylalanine--tRNA ligase beta subunit [Clostridium formicaceticum]